MATVDMGSIAHSGDAHRFRLSAPSRKSASFSFQTTPASVSAFRTKSAESLCDFDFSPSQSTIALALTAAAVARSSCDQPIDLGGPFASTIGPTSAKVTRHSQIHPTDLKRTLGILWALQGRPAT